MGLYSNIKPIFDVKPMGFYAREYGTKIYTIEI